MARLCIGQTWDGHALAEDERASVTLRLGDAELLVEVEAPFHDDPRPPEPAGARDALWDFGVVEIFLLGEAARYLEIELGPFGHHLVLQLRGARHIEASGLPLEFTAHRRGARWRGLARVPVAYLPPGLHACNAYAIHGPPERRRYLAAYPAEGSEPDFHRLESFRPLDW
jgi:hypothetical protein